jgi:hypothetical protein
MPTPSWRQRARFQPRQGRRGGWSAAMAQPRARIFTGKIQARNFKYVMSKENFKNLDNGGKNKRQTSQKLGVNCENILHA